MTDEPTEPSLDPEEIKRMVLGNDSKKSAGKSDAITMLLATAVTLTSAYRDQLVSANFSKEAAETMAVDFHRAILTTMMPG